MKLATKIRNARLNLSQKLGYQISQSEFAKMCGFGEGQSRVSNYETGKRAPSLEDLLRIIAVSGANPIDFFDPYEVEGMDIEHINQAFNKVAEESAIPKNMFRTIDDKAITNSVPGFLVDPASPAFANTESLRFAVFFADRKTDVAEKGDLIYTCLENKSITETGWWVYKVGNAAIHDYVRVMPSGELQSREYGVINPEDIVIIGSLSSIHRLL